MENTPEPEQPEEQVTEEVIENPLLKQKRGGKAPYVLPPTSSGIDKKPRKPVVISEEERKIRSERMKVVNAARIAKAQETKAVLIELEEKKQQEKLEKIKQKKEQITGKVAEAKSAPQKQQPPAKVEKKSAKKVIKIVNRDSEGETDSESDGDIVIVNTRPKSKSAPKQVQAQPKAPASKPEVICKFV